MAMETGSQFFRKFLVVLFEDRIFPDMQNPDSDLFKLWNVEGISQVPGGEAYYMRRINEIYFPEEVQTTYPFLKDPEFVKEFWHSFSDQIQARIRLSNREGAKQAFLPSSQGVYSVQTRRNIYTLAYGLTLRMEKFKIQKLIDAEEDETKKEQDQKLLDEGKLRLVITDEEEHYISEEEVAAAAAEPEIKKTKVKTFVPVKFEPEKIAAEKTVGKELPPEVMQEEEQAAVTETTFEELPEDNQKIEENRLTLLMEENGLEVVEKIEIDETTGLARGRIRDVTGAVVEVEIDTKRERNDNQRIRFIYTDSEGRLRDHTMSENDLPKFRDEKGKRKSVADVARIREGERYEPTEKAPLAREVPRPIGGTRVELKPKEEAAGGGGATVVSFVPGPKAAKAPEEKESVREQVRKALAPEMPKTGAPTEEGKPVYKKKLEPAVRKKGKKIKKPQEPVIKEEAEKPQEPAAAGPTPEEAPGRTVIAAAPPPPPKKNKMKWVAGITSVGIPSLAVGGPVASVLFDDQAKAEQVIRQTGDLIVFLLQCLNNICFI
jgi:hypothetical protein